MTLFLTLFFAEIQDQVVEMVKIVTALRSEDMWGLYDKCITKIPHVGTLPRHVKIVMLTTKNDKLGLSPEVDRTNMVPCHCVMKTEGIAAKKTVQDLFKLDINAPCTEPGCVYGLLVTYMAMCPEDPHKAANANSRLLYSCFYLIY